MSYWLLYEFNDDVLVSLKMSSRCAVLSNTYRSNQLATTTVASRYTVLRGGKLRDFLCVITIKVHRTQYQA